ncbi:hypothetical protein CC80DRAFT_421714 [Byssothecium circinans]|uniref:Uncharacterized protein n=1 Tax=Byssothecium circinans TaxID=147558 RepID=A0A6A5TM39_9PLEO|nr:hypothetical protein CC80DRAFT_421714 [Byssothecium circinans]
MSEIEDEKRSRNRDLGTRTTNLEDWILANFCVTVGLSTMGFVAWYWIEIITLTFRTFFYWTCTMVKGVKHDEAWATLVCAIVLRVYGKFEGLKAKGVLGQFLDVGRLPFEFLKFLLHTVGFRIGSGPLFDRLPDEWKAARRACKTPEDVANFFAVFAGPSGEESDDEEDAQDRNDEEEAYFPPSVFEWQPNPVILHYLRDEHLQSLNSGPSVADSTWKLLPGYGCRFDDEDTAKDDQTSPGASRHTGPATMSVHLSSFACPQCTYVAQKKFELKYAIILFLMSTYAKRW